MRRLSAALTRQNTGITTANYVPGVGRNGILPRVMDLLREPAVTWNFYRLAWGLGPNRIWRARGVGAYASDVFAIRDFVANFDGYVLADEGLLHHCFSMAFGNSLSEASLKVVSSMFRDYYLELRHVMVYVDVPVDECIRRFAGRDAPDSSFHKDTPLRIIDRFRGDRSYQALLECYSDATGRSPIVINDPDNLDVLLARIAT